MGGERTMISTEETSVTIDATRYGENIANVEVTNGHKAERSPPQTGIIGPVATSGFEATRFTGRPFVIVTVGLPGRGKSYIARRIMRFLSWLGLKTCVFQVRGYRRKQEGKVLKHSPEFFDHGNEENSKIRDQVVENAIDDMIEWLRQGGNVGIMDGQNVQQKRRDLIYKKLSTVLDGDRILFLEVDESNKDRLANYKDMTLKCSSSYSDFASLEEASEDFDRRAEYYRKAQEPLSADSPFIKMENGGSDLVLNKVHGYLPCRVCNFLMNVNLSMQPIFLSRHGQSEFNLLGRIGGDSGLTDFGENYAQELAHWLRSNAPDGLEVWCSTLLRTRMTAVPMTGSFPTVYWRALEEIDAGVYDGLTYEEIQEQATVEFEKRKKNKYWYRYPHGESYHDLVARLEPVIMELERSKKPLLIISHQAVLRVIYAYLVESKPEYCTNLSMPLHTVVKLMPTYEGKFVEERVPILETDPEMAAVGTHGKEDVVETAAGSRNNKDA
ncbi:6-phosphofructo-2-kinase/fructose-2 [Diplonema papillatum]|nr:6-phosphofructo-2-kinase/fructose-2 [Diplonema papillatum]